MVGSANRYALLADGNEGNLSSKPKKSPPDNPLANPVADDDYSWQVACHRGATNKSKSKPVVSTTGQVNNRPLPAIVTHQNKKRALSNNMSVASPSATSVTTSSSKQPMLQTMDYCGVCNVKYKTKSAILAHMKQHSSNHGNFCNLCRRVFKDRNGIKNHVENSVGHDIFCNMCLSAFVDQGGLKNHFENNYALGHSFVCLTCLKGFEYDHKLARHLENDPRHVSCETCKLTFKNQDERDAHWRNTTKHKHCLQTGCERDFETAAQLEQHLEDDHFRCEGCKQILPSQTKLARHLEACKFAVPCPNCDQLLPGQVALATHVASCFYCSQCKWRYDTEEQLQIHRDKHSISDSSFDCWACSSPQGSFRLLIKHLEYCPTIPRTLIFSVLADSYNTALYMDVDVRAQIRRGQKQNDFDLEELVKWSDQGCLYPFICRAEGTCYKVGEEAKVKFGRLSELLMHVQSRECAWNIERLRLDIVQEQFARTCEIKKRKDSVLGYH